MKKDWTSGGVALLIQVMYSGDIIASIVRVYFSILWKILHLSTLHAVAAKRKYRNWIRQTVNNENIKSSIFRKSEFLCYFGSLAAQWRLQRKPIAVHAIEFRPHSPTFFRLWVTLWATELQAPHRFSFRVRNPTFGDAYSWQRARVFHALHFGRAPFCKVIEHTLIVAHHARKTGGKTKKERKRERGNGNGEWNGNIWRVAQRRE